MMQSKFDKISKKSPNQQEKANKQNNNMQPLKIPVILSASTSLRSSKTPPPVNRLLTLVSSSLVDCVAVVSPDADDDGEEAVVESSLLFPFESFSATKFLYSISGILCAGIFLLNITESGVFLSHCG